MPNEICTLLPDESWVMLQYRQAKKSGYSELVIKIHDGTGEWMTATHTEKFKRRSDDKTVLKD